MSRGKVKRADYILYYKPNSPIDIVEAKDNCHSVGDGMQQRLWNMPRRSISLSCSPPTGMDLSFTTGPAPVRRWKTNLLAERVSFSRSAVGKIPCVEGTDA